MDLRSDIQIAASAERVWEVLTDFASFPDWNPFIREASGPIQEGGRIRVRIHPPGGMPMTFKPKLLSVEPGRELRWLGNLLMPGLFDGEHRFLIEPDGPGHVRLMQSEHFSGILTPLFNRLMGLGPKTQSGFDAMNAALKARAEAT